MSTAIKHTRFHLARHLSPKPPNLLCIFRFVGLRGRRQSQTCQHHHEGQNIALNGDSSEQVTRMKLVLKDPAAFFGATAKLLFLPGVESGPVRSMYHAD